MPDTRPSPFPTAVAVPEIAVEDVALRLGLAAVLGVSVAAVYFVTQRKTRAEAASFVSTLVLLTILLALVSMVIGNDIARAFSLVGALSIVRFRTVVEDTRDTAFVIFAVIAGMAAGAEVYLVPAVGIPLVAVVAWCLTAWGQSARPPAGDARGVPTPASTLVIRTGTGSAPGAALAEVLAEHLQDFRLVAAVTARQGAAIDQTYSVRLKAAATPVGLLAALNKLEGVQGVDWSETEKT